MKAFRCLFMILCAATGFGFHTHLAEASEPSVHAQLLTPSPLGRDRILVLCSHTKSDNNFVSQFYDRVKWDEFSERQLTIVELSQNSLQTVTAETHRDTKKRLNKTRLDDFSDQLRLKAACQNRFEFVLIGKDMGVKKRWENAIAQEELFQIIDAMPMRRFEVRRSEARQMRAQAKRSQHSPKERD